MKVVFITTVVQFYRTKFHELVREKLAAKGIEYVLVYGQPQEKDIIKKDTVDIPWAVFTENFYFRTKNSTLIFKNIFPYIKGADLVIVGQENKIIENYALQIGRKLLGIKLAFWGHGKNFQSKLGNGRAERWKRFWATKVDWWFGYTEETRSHLANIGFDKYRVTVFNNSIDTNSIREELNSVSNSDKLSLKNKLGIESANIGLYVGGLYPEKRIEFLIESALEIRRQVPDFHLIIIGGGQDSVIAKEAAERQSWIHFMGPKFGSDRTLLSSLGAVFLMPGLVGLSILDSFVLGTPMVTTTYPHHSPEIAYLKNGVNGIVVDEWTDHTAYANAVSKLLMDKELLRKMSLQASKSASTYTVESMAEKFSAGIFSALS